MPLYECIRLPPLRGKQLLIFLHSWVNRRNSTEATAHIRPNLSVPDTHQMKE